MSTEAFSASILALKATCSRYRLYGELQAKLHKGRDEFQSFVTTAVAKYPEVKAYGACELPGWQDFVETNALPNNRETMNIINKILAVEQVVDGPVREFIEYHSDFESQYLAYKKGENQYWKWTAKRNFPYHLNGFIDGKMFSLRDELSRNFADMKREYTIAMAELHEKEVQFLELTRTQPQEKKSMSRSLRVFVAGLGLGALASRLLSSKEETLTPPPTAVPAKPQFISEEAQPVAPEVLPVIAEEEDFDDTTPDKSDSSTLIDGLEGVTIPGKQFKGITVRTAGLAYAKTVAMWGTKGKFADQPTTFQRLVDLTTEHLIAIKTNSQKVTDDERLVINSILEDRVAAGEADESVLNN